MGINSSTKAKLIENLRYVIGLRRKQMAALEQLLKWAEATLNKMTDESHAVSEAEQRSIKLLGFILFNSPFDLDKMEKLGEYLEGLRKLEKAGEQYGDLRRGT